MGSYLSLIDVDDQSVQNVQDLGAIWGAIRTEIEEHDAELVDSYAVLGEYDFVVVFEAENENAAFQTALTLRRHGLDAQTMPLVAIEDFAHLAEDV